ncbi:aminopeptidase P family protein [Ureaplasma ceti]|uniref:Aminopeptidase P family protein n=1 Tax=Ureaplasma ceti TaxID=3119530 RepID=A0ABP9U613_9BACT
MNKRELLAEFLTKSGVDGCAFLSDVNRYWYTGFMSTAGYIFVNKNGRSIMLIDGRYFFAAKDAVKNIDEVRLLDGNLLGKIEEILKELEITSLALSAEYTNLEQLIMFKKINGLKISDFKSGLLRQVKEESELDSLRKAADIAALTIEWIKTQNIVGLTEKQVATMITIHMLEMGAEKNSFEPIVASGVNGAVPHHHCSDKKIEDGDMVTTDIGCIVDGYCSDITRTFVAGDITKANPKMIEIYNVVLKAQKLGIEKSEMGLTGADIDKIVRDVIDEAGYGEYFTHSTGHGVGIEVHEFPWISKNYNGEIKDFSVFTIEPGIYVPGLGGVRIEDTICLVNNKVEVLTRKAEK